MLQPHRYVADSVANDTMLRSIGQQFAHDNRHDVDVGRPQQELGLGEMVGL